MKRKASSFNKSYRRSAEAHINKYGEIRLRRQTLVNLKLKEPCNSNKAFGNSLRQIFTVLANSITRNLSRNF